MIKVEIEESESAPGKYNIWIDDDQINMTVDGKPRPVSDPEHYAARWLVGTGYAGPYYTCTRGSNVCRMRFKSAEKAAAVSIVEAKDGRGLMVVAYKPPESGLNDEDE